MACMSACEKLKHGRIQMKTGKASLEDRKGLIWQPRQVRATARTSSRARFAHGPHARICVIAIRRENAPRRIRAGGVDGENVDGECCVNLERTGLHAGACVKLHVLRAACSVRGTMRSGFPGRYARAGLHGKPRRFGAWVTSLGTSQRELWVSGACWLAWRTPRRQALVAMPRATTRPQVLSDGRDKRASQKPPPW